MKILFIIDCQKGFSRHANTEATAKKIVELSNSHKFDYIIATEFINKPNSAYVNYIHWTRFMAGEDIELVDGLNYDKLLKKTRYTAITPNVLRMLKNINGGTKPKEVYVCGIDTDCCVLQTAVTLFEHNIRPIVLANYCNSNGGERMHEAALDILRRNIGSEQISDLEF